MASEARAASRQVKGPRKPPRRSLWRWLAVQLKEMTVVVGALSVLLVYVQVAFPGLPQTALTRFAVFVDRFFPAAPEQEIPLQAPPLLVEEYKEAELVLDQADDFESMGGILEFPFYPAFDDGYVYFEVGYDNRMTEQGRLGMPSELASLPDFLAIEQATVLRAYGQVRVRSGAARTTSKVDTIRAGECVFVIDNALKRNAVKTNKARTGGWLRVAHTECPLAAATATSIRR